MAGDFDHTHYGDHRHTAGPAYSQSPISILRLRFHNKYSNYIFRRTRSGGTKEGLYSPLSGAKQLFFRQSIGLNKCLRAKKIMMIFTISACKSRHTFTRIAYINIGLQLSAYSLRNHICGPKVTIREQSNDTLHYSI